MKAYKAFNPDMTCRGFQYEIGKTFEIKEEPIANPHLHYTKRRRDI